MSYTILNDIFTYFHKYPAAPYRLQTSKICLGYRMGMAPDTWLTRPQNGQDVWKRPPHPSASPSLVFAAATQDGV
jgi:hypothetical protein